PRLPGLGQRLPRDGARPGRAVAGGAAPPGRRERAFAQPVRPPCLLGRGVAGDGHGPREDFRPGGPRQPGVRPAPALWGPPRPGGCGARPAAVIGYSLGEPAGLFALRAWAGRDRMLQAMGRPPLFARALTGPCDAARAAWGLPAGADVDWVTGVVDRPPADVR